MWHVKYLCAWYKCGMFLQYSTKQIYTIHAPNEYHSNASQDNKYNLTGWYGYSFYLHFHSCWLSILFSYIIQWFSFMHYVCYYRYQQASNCKKVLYDSLQNCKNRKTMFYTVELIVITTELIQTALWRNITRSILYIIEIER